MNQAIFERNANLPEPWNTRFPTTGEEMQTWTASITFHALHFNVLCVARTRAEGTWGAYISAVPGLNHDNEWEAVANQGGKLSESVARAIFPGFDDVPYAK